MKLLFQQNLLILIVIALICSITPATAVETKAMSNDWYSPWDKGLEEIAKVIEGDDTELTVEQSAYLETHQDQVQIKGETVLNSLQNYINYLINEYNEYYANTEQQQNPIQTKLLETKNDNYKQYYANTGLKQQNPIQTKLLETKNAKYIQYYANTEQQQNPIQTKLLETKNDNYKQYYANTGLKQQNPIQTKLLETKNAKYIQYYANTEQQQNPIPSKLSEKKSDKYDKDLKKVRNYLKSINIPTTKDSLSYINLSENWNNKLYANDDGVIIQIDDKGYIRYMKVVSVNKTDIHVRSDKKDFTMSAATFKNMYLLNKDFNIIVVPKDYDTTTALHDILTCKRDDLSADINWCNWGQALCIPVAVLGISGIVLNGVWKCCEACKTKAATDIKKPKLDEKSPLLARYDEERAEIQADSSCCKKPRTIIVLGTLITLGAATGSIISVAVKNCKEADLKNLGEYV